MDRGGSETSLVLVVVALLAVVFALFVGGMMLVSRPMMGGMMGGGGSGAGWWDAGVFVLAVVVAVIALAFALRPSRGPSAPAAHAPPPIAWPAPPGASPEARGAPATPEDAARLERLQEAAIVKVLDEDERRLYLQIREGGGTALQRDLVASGAFSKAKVTRLLDKLERKGLVVRERYGATNRVRLTWKGAPPAP